LITTGGSASRELRRTPRYARPIAAWRSDYIPTDEFESTVETLKSRGIDFFMDVRQREDFGVGVKTAFVKDPDGNVIEMTDVPPFN